MPAELLRRWADSADVLLAADAGADRLLDAGATPDLILGDLDSISERARACGAEVRHIDDQSTTDCDKLLRTAFEMGHREVTLASIEGDSLDHLIGSVYSAARAPLKVRLALRTGVAHVLHAGAFALDTKPGRRVSLLPVLPCAGVSLQGVRWPLEEAELSPAGLVSISNEAVSETVRVSLASGTALLVAEYPQEEMPRWS